MRAAGTPGQAGVTGGGTAYRGDRGRAGSSVGVWSVVRVLVGVFTSPVFSSARAWRRGSLLC